MASPLFAILLLALATVPESVRSQNTTCSTEGSLCADTNFICFHSKCVPFVGLGGTCSIRDVCYNKPDATLKLACVSNKCLIQVGQTCASNTDKCVTGAACNSSSLCACTQGYLNWQPNNAFMSNECRRQAKLGEDCSDGADCVSDDNGPDITCDPYKFTCAIKAKQACTDSTGQYCTTGSTCHSGHCTCNPPYSSDKGACSKTISTVGGVCRQGDKCENKNLPVHIHCDHLAERCLLEVGEVCSTYRDKCSTGAVCSTDTKTCVCTAPFVNDGRKCVGQQGTFGGQCKTGNKCSNPQAQCNDDGYCFCKPGYTFRASDSTCVSDGTGGAGRMAVPGMSLLVVAVLIITLH